MIDKKEMRWMIIQKRDMVAACVEESAGGNERSAHESCWKLISVAFDSSRLL
jgi:hypothetical protein